MDSRRNLHHDDTKPQKVGLLIQRSRRSFLDQAAEESLCSIAVRCSSQQVRSLVREGRRTAARRSFFGFGCHGRTAVGHVCGKYPSLKKLIPCVRLHAFVRNGPTGGCATARAVGLVPRMYHRGIIFKARIKSPLVCPLVLVVHHRAVGSWQTIYADTEL